MATSWESPSTSSASSETSKLTRGTSILTVRPPTNFEKAVAAWPPPMLATSRRASSCCALGTCRSIFQKPRDIEDENGLSASQDLNPRQPGNQMQWGWEDFKHHLFLTQKLVHCERYFSRFAFADDIGPDSARGCGGPAQQRGQLVHRQKPTLMRKIGAVPAARELPGVYRRCPEHLGDRQPDDFLRHLGEHQIDH